MIDAGVKVRMNVCPECGNANRVAIEHEMEKEDRDQFEREAIKYGFVAKTITLDEYRNSDVNLYCKPTCTRNKPINPK